MLKKPLIFLIVFNLALVLFLVFWLRPSWQIGGDGFGYVSYYRSVAYDHDFNFRNEYEAFDLTYHAHQAGILTPSGKVANQFSVGPAILSSPFLAVASLAVKLGASDVSQYNLSGYGQAYQAAIFLSSLVYFLFGLSLLYLSLRKIFTEVSSSRSVFWAVMFAWLASPLIYYVVYEPSMSHVFAFFATSGLLYFSLKARENFLPRNFFFCGLWLGLAMLCRWQSLYFVILPLVYIFWNKENSNSKIQSLIMLGAGSLIAIFPQLLVWRHLFGSWLAIPQGVSFFQIFQPHIWEFLFSSYHGMFFWHPALLLGIMGLALAWRREAKLVWAIVAILALEIWLNAGLVDWFGGSSFGARRMIECLPLFALGFAYFFEAVEKTKKPLVRVIAYLIFAGLIFANLSLLSDVGKGIVPLNRPINFPDWKLVLK